TQGIKSRDIRLAILLVHSEDINGGRDGCAIRGHGAAAERAGASPCEMLHAEGRNGEGVIAGDARLTDKRGKIDRVRTSSEVERPLRNSAGECDGLLREFQLLIRQRRNQRSRIGRAPAGGVVPSWSCGEDKGSRISTGT